MKELNIGKCIARKRKEKGITQERLADYIGVSKASVSKWETGQSYPDIVFLPKLAAFFNITIDELIEYSPQMPKKTIKKIYHTLSHEFVTKPFEEVMEQCRSIIKEHYACFPLQLAMIQLLLNHANLATAKDEKEAIFHTCIQLCQRIKDESSDSGELKSANAMEALSEIALGDHERVIDLLKNHLTPYSGEDVLLLQAYQMNGGKEQALKVCQIMIFQNLISTLSLLTHSLALHMTEPELFEQIYTQAKHLIEDFQMKIIGTNAVFAIHIVAAQGYLAQHENEKALGALEQYVDTVCQIKFPFKLRGNSYFTRIDQWLEDSGTIGTSSPRDDEAVRRSFIQTMEANPAFQPIKKETMFQKLIAKLKRKLGDA